MLPETRRKTPCEIIYDKDQIYSCVTVQGARRCTTKSGRASHRHSIGRAQRPDAVLQLMQRLSSHPHEQVVKFVGTARLFCAQDLFGDGRSFAHLLGEHRPQPKAHRGAAAGEPERPRAHPARASSLRVSCSHRCLSRPRLRLSSSCDLLLPGLKGPPQRFVLKGPPPSTTAGSARARGGRRREAEAKAGLKRG